MLELTDEIKNAFAKLRDKLETTTVRKLRLAKPRLRYAILCHASYQSSGFIILIEDYVKNSHRVTGISYTPVSSQSKVFNTWQLKMQQFCKEFLALYFALRTFPQFIRRSEKPILTLTDKKSLTSFLETKTIPPSLWNYVDSVTAFNKVVTETLWNATAAADFFSRLQLSQNETIVLNLTEKIPVREAEIEVGAKLSDIRNQGALPKIYLVYFMS